VTAHDQFTDGAIVAGVVRGIVDHGDGDVPYLRVGRGMVRLDQVSDAAVVEPQWRLGHVVRDARSRVFVHDGTEHDIAPWALICPVPRDGEGQAVWHADDQLIRPLTVVAAPVDEDGAA
jgi:hypothetical protein